MRGFRIGWLVFCIGILTGELEVAQAQVLTGEYGRQFIIDDGFAFEQYEERRALQEQFAFAPAASAVLEADSLALVTLYNETNGADWRENTNWLTGPVANWFGVTVEGNRVVSLDLRANMLTGDLPNAITDLTALRFLDLSVNFYQGLIPLTIDALQDVEHLALGSSFLGGTIPVEIINLSNLRYLRLYGQELGGVISAELSSLSNLEYLEIRGDNLIGEIPSTLGNLSQLEYLIISGVNLTGEIPASLSNLSSLKELQIYNTSITGAIPAALEALENLTVLRLDFNILEGSIPLWLTNLSSLETLNLASNRFTGTIPPELAELTNLKHLLVGNNTIPLPPDPPPAGNLLTGSIPPELGNLINLETLDVGGNQLEGTIPVELGNLSNLKFANFPGNQLEGTIPATLASLPSLSFASFEFNQLDDLPVLPSFQRLHLNNNKFTFEDLEPNVGKGFMYYTPQALIGEVTSEDVTTGGELMLHIPVGGASNVYQWYHDGVSIPGANTDTYTIINATADDAGVYTLEVTNTVATALTLESHPITVTVVGGPSNVGPEVTITDGPTGTQAPGEMTFVWSGSDPDGTVVGYEWALVGPETASASTTSMSVTLGVQGEGAYTFRVRAEDDDGAFSDWSERTFSVELTNSLPEITITEGPTGSVGAGAIVFTWQGSDPDGSIVGYEWELAGPQYAEGTTTSNTLTLEALPEGAYLFRIRAQDNEGAFSDWAEQAFAIDIASAPQAQADAATTPEDTALPAIDVLGNDTDPDGTALSVTSDRTPSMELLPLTPMARSAIRPTRISMVLIRSSTP